VVRHLRETPPDFAQVHLLKGNHEEMMLRALGQEPELIPDWLMYGGMECAESYGIAPHELLTEDLERLAYVLAASIPAKDLAFLASGHDSIRFGDYLLVHAGIRPGVALADQSGQDVRWIRKDFLESTADHGVVVVHGHTISDAVVERRNRIGIDTGAYKFGVLTALRIEGPERSFLSTGEKGDI
jgi:serine/threonine protein phosphatase 1